MCALNVEYHEGNSHAFLAAGEGIGSAGCMVWRNDRGSRIPEQNRVTREAVAQCSTQL